MKCLVDATKPHGANAAFSNLVDLSLGNLVELEELCKGQQPQQFLEKLKNLRIYNCPEMIGAIPILQNLKTLRVTSCDKIQVLFQTIELGCTQALNRHVSLKCLKVVQIYECNNLSSLFPATVANSLGQLKTLKIHSCSMLEEIIQETEVMPNISLQSLRDVHIEGCNNLTSLSSLSHGHILANLKNLTVNNCSRLQCAFPNSKAEGLPQLNRIRLENLPQLKGRDGNDIVLMLPSLQELSVKDCPQFISAEIQVAEMGSAQQMLTQHGSFKSLKAVYIDSCNTWIYLFPAVVVNSLGQLEKLKVIDCSELEEIIQRTEVSNINLQSLKFVKIHGCNKLRYLFAGTVANSLGQLEKLAISGCSELKEIIQGMEVSNINLQSLREVYIDGCDNLTSLSSVSHGHILKNLKKLDILHCSLLEYTFPTSMAEGLPQLNEIRLEGLPQLKGMDGNDIVLTLPSLQDLRVTSCPQLTPFIISAKIQELDLHEMTEREETGNIRMMPELRGRSANMECLTISNFQDHLFDAAFNLSNLKKIRLWKLPQLQVVWKGPIQFVSFQNLIDLELRFCRKLRYIFSSPTIAQNLALLGSLHIQFCGELEQIIEKDETSSQAICFANLTSIRISFCKNMKSLFPVGVARGLSKLKKLNLSKVSNLENVFEKGDEADVSDDKEKVIHLPQLEWLKLKDLPKIKTFSPMAHHFVLPSLRKLKVTSCPNISTRFSVDSKKWGHTITESETIRSIDENVVEDSPTTHQTIWPIGSDIHFPED
ncbi:hypothetical protein PTKIN_Ptkin14bG0156300 [Pterospermum kingtungense]